MSSREVLVINPQKLNKTNKALAIRRGQGYAADYVGHITLEDVRSIINIIKKDRDKLLVSLIYDGCLRVSEAISIRPQDIVQSTDGWQIRVTGKGSKYSAVAVSASLVAQLQAYAYREMIPPDTNIFSINRTRVFQIIQKAMEDAGIVKPEHVGAVHVLRHSGALERLRRTGNPKAVQDQLRHASAAMTLRYMKTLAHEESLKIQQGIDLQW